MEFGWLSLWKWIPKPYVGSSVLPLIQNPNCIKGLAMAARMVMTPWKE
jgi:hypothetical protein